MIHAEYHMAEGGILLLDGGMGQELLRRGGGGETGLWSAQALLDDPDLVRQVHVDFIRADAKVIITNTYATIAHRLENIAGLGHRWAELMDRAGQLAVEARQQENADILIAGALPPLYGSYLPDQVRPFSEIEPMYRAHVEALVPYVDVFICETMSSAAEGYAAAHAAAAAGGGKPVWVAWTLADDEGKRLRSGETLAEAWAALAGLPVEAAMANCSSPESLSAAMADLVALGAPNSGGYANGFAAIPDGWRITDGVAELGRRRDFTPDAYAAHALAWVEAGANIIGGCCEVGPAHIARIAECLNERSAS